MSASPPPRENFAPTRWSLVWSAGHASTPTARAALSELCAAYWYPLYAYVRRQGHDPHAAADLTQSFFARLLERNDFAAAEREKGRFRAYLLAALRHFLSDERDRANAVKRGGAANVFSLDFEAAEGAWREEPVTHETPERAFERRFAEELLARALGRVERGYAERGERRTFAVLARTLTAPGDASHDDLARELETTAGAVKVAAHRLRERWRAALREEVADLVATPEDVDDELAALFAALSD
ncbi:MAG: sigma-70 family RNA polymerase sigma factor [Planctomycetes bacterium]|nr:sigma-70 family RNA polymerase sigma factor [Planctomycetota bacterium]